MNNPTLFRNLVVLALLCFSVKTYGQTAKWNTTGNVAANGDFLGTTNNQPLLFYTNNAEVMRLKPNGELRVNSLGGFGRGFVTVNNNGVLATNPFSTDSFRILTEAGTFRYIGTVAGWAYNGNDIYSYNNGNVGIGTGHPMFLLDVNGDANVNGTLNAKALMLTDKMQADTVSGMKMITVNDNLNLAAGIQNEMYTYSGDIRLQSRSGYNGNLLLVSGTTGKVGIGMFTPQYKLDVNGDARFSGNIRTAHIKPLPGDTVVIIGDSSIYFSAQNRIYPTPNSNATYKGIGLGNYNASGLGANSVAIGSRVTVGSLASNAIVIGSGAINGTLLNTIPNSIMLGTNSSLPTVFISPANGIGTTGKVGIATTTPGSDLQVGNTWTSISVGAAPNVAVTYSSAFVGFNVSHPAAGQWQTAGNGYLNGGALLINDMSGGIRVVTLPSTGTGTQSWSDAQIQFNTRLQVRNDGRVIIGADAINSGGPYDNSMTRLTVDGRIMCKDVVVSLVDWPDYVFDSTYTLMPMDTLGQYVALYRHLPGTPAASVQESNGASLADTCKKQQQQIEELTLYILQLNERLKALEAQNNDQEGCQR